MSRDSYIQHGHRHDPVNGTDKIPGIATGTAAVTWFYAYTSGTLGTDSTQDFASGTASLLTYRHVRSNDTAKDTFRPLETQGGPPPTSDTVWAGDGQPLTEVALLKPGKYRSYVVTHLASTPPVPCVLSIKGLDYSAGALSITPFGDEVSDASLTQNINCSYEFLVPEIDTANPFYLATQFFQQSGSLYTLRADVEWAIVYEGDTGAGADIATW